MQTSLYYKLVYKILAAFCLFVKREPTECLIIMEIEINFHAISTHENASIS